MRSPRPASPRRTIRSARSIPTSASSRFPIRDWPRLAAIARPERIVPTTVEFVDIAGLVAGASKGEGLGNQFLATIRETDAIAHVVRCFADDNVVHVAGAIDPESDIETINANSPWPISPRWRSSSASTRRLPGREATRTRNAWSPHSKRSAAALNQAQPARTVELYPEQWALLKPLFLLTMKPTMYVANVDEHGFSGNAMLAAVEQRARREGAPVVAISAALEAQIADLEPEDREVFLADMGLAEAGLDRLIHAAYKLLGLETFFTAGPKELRAWTLAQGSTAPQAAGVIHTDFEKGFIRAEVIAYADYITCQGEQGAKEAGKMRLEGREYVVRDGDVMHIRFNV